MTIAAIDVFEFHRSLDGTAWNPTWRWHERRAPILRIRLADGTHGIGEAWSRPGNEAAFYAEARSAIPALLGRSTAPTEPSATWQAAAFASAVDIALWDARARSAGIPLHQAIGAQHPRVPVYASGGLYRDGGWDIATEMDAYAAHGFTAMKMKIGALPMAEDLARLRAATRLGRRIIVDAVEQWTRATAPAWIDALARIGVAAVQAPLPADDLDGMAQLQARGPLPILGLEREWRPQAFQTLLDRRAVGILQFNPGLAGGITGALRLIAMAAAAGVPASLQCYSTAVMQAACLHLGAGRPIWPVEYHRFHDGLHEALPPAMRTIHDGHVHLDETPGLGIDHLALSTMEAIHAR